MLENNIRPWVIEVYSDPRMSDVYAAYAEGNEDDVEEIIGTAEETWQYLLDAHIGEWDSYVEEDEYEDWICDIGPHAKEITEEEWNDVEFRKWFDNLEVIYDERPN